MSQLKFEALEAKCRAEMLEAKATLETYFANSVGIGEHPEFLKEMEKLLEKYSNAEGRLEALYNVVTAATETEGSELEIQEEGE